MLSVFYFMSFCICLCYLSHFLKLYSAVFFPGSLHCLLDSSFTFLIFRDFQRPLSTMLAASPVSWCPTGHPHAASRLPWPFSSCCQHFCQLHPPEQASRFENGQAAHSVNPAVEITAPLCSIRLSVQVTRPLVREQQRIFCSSPSTITMTIWPI